MAQGARGRCALEHAFRPRQCVAAWCAAAAARGQAAVIVSHPPAVEVAAGLAPGGIFVLALGASGTIAAERGP